jgi:hypothetical protein
MCSKISAEILVKQTKFLTLVPIFLTKFLTFRPKSPPNSPNPELASLSEELKDVYINAFSGIESDMVWDWSSRPNLPFK